MIYFSDTCTLFFQKVKKLFSNAVAIFKQPFVCGLITKQIIMGWEKITSDIIHKLSRNITHV